MAKDPAFLFYPNDWIGGTMGMTFEDKGAYIELLMAQFNRGHMTKHMIGQIVGQLWDNIQDKFEVDDKGLYFNRRLEEEQFKRKTYTESRRNNKSGKNQHTSKSKKKEGHMTLHMEDVNENENIIVIKNEKNIPSEFEFLEHAKESCLKANVNYEGLEFTIKSKYESWVSAKWKDGNDKKIKNWKTKFNNTLPYLKPIKNNSNGQISTNEALSNLIQ